MISDSLSKYVKKVLRLRLICDDDEFYTIHMNSMFLLKGGNRIFKRQDRLLRKKRNFRKLLTDFYYVYVKLIY